MIGLSDVERDYLFAFIPFRNRGYQLPIHLAPLIDRLQRIVVNREPARLLLSAPPRHGKSETIVNLCAWVFRRNPKAKIAYVTYGQTLSYAMSRKVQKLCDQLGIELLSRAVSAWETVEGGRFTATTIQGQITGFGYDLVLIDDPFKDRASAESTVIRDKTIEWFNGTVYSRIEPSGSMIVIGTRWHPDDLIGKLEAHSEAPWEVINVPAISDDGAALWPLRFDVSALDDIRRQIGEYDWSSLYQGRPRRKGNALFREPARYQTPQLEGSRIVVACDPAATEKSHADYSAIVVLAYRGSGATAVADVLEVFRAQVEIPKLCSILVQFQNKYKAPLIIEAAGVGKAVPQVLRGINPHLNIREVMPQGDKFTRAQPVSAAWNDGRVRVPMQAAWLNDFLVEMTSFTGVNDSHDDMVDGCSLAWNAIHMASPEVKRLSQVADYLPFG